MAQNGRLQNRAYSPYAVDSLEVPEVPPKDPSSLNRSYQNVAYSNLGFAKSQEDLSSRPSTPKGSYQNPAYENAELAHQYEDPSHLLATSATSSGPRRKRNELYEPTEINKDHETKDDDYNEGIGRDSWLSRLILFLILIVSLTSLLLVALIILGKVGPVCSSCDEEQASLPSGEKFTGSQSTEEPRSSVVSPPDVSALENKINELKANLSWIKSFMNTLQQDVQSTRSELTDTNRNINGTKDKVLQIQSGTQNSINMIQNISQRLDASVRALNVTFFGELTAIKTSFDSKLNNTAQSLLNADSSLQARLDIVNTSLREKVQSISKLQGPEGPRGNNGTKGDQGPVGSKGQQGDQGTTGDKGDSGVKGDRGVNGTDGAVGQKGDTGPQGDKGDPGAQGPKGIKGDRGPQGSQGAGNFSLCSYKEKEGTPVSPGAPAEVDVTEELGKKILGVSCSTNKAKEYNLERIILPTQQNQYKCYCRGVSKLFIPSGSVLCKVHYWECPLTT